MNESPARQQVIQIVVHILLGAGNSKRRVCVVFFVLREKINNKSIIFKRNVLEKTEKETLALQ